MRKALSMLLLLFGLAAGHTTAAHVFTTDSQWWGSLSPSMQATVAQGIVSGYQSGFYDGVLAKGLAFGNFVAADRRNNRISEATYSRYSKVLLKPMYVTYSKTADTYANGVTQFYRSYPDLQHTEVSEIVSCLADKPVMTCRELAQLLRWEHKVQSMSL